MTFTENNTFVDWWMSNHCIWIFDLWTFKKHTAPASLHHLQDAEAQAIPARADSGLQTDADAQVCFSKVMYVLCVTCHIMSLMTSIDIRQVILMLLRSCPGSPLHVLLPEVFLVSALLASSASGSGAGEGALAPRSRREAPGERDSELPGQSSRAVDGSVHVGTGWDERFWRETTSMSFHDDEIHQISTLYSWLENIQIQMDVFLRPDWGPIWSFVIDHGHGRPSQMYLMDHLGKVRIPLFEPIYNRCISLQFWIVFGSTVSHCHISGW